MSNVVKWNYVNFDSQGKHIINSDTSADLDPGRIMEGLKIKSPQDVADFFLHGGEEKKEETSKNPLSFTPGMNIVNYDKQMEEEKERIAQEADSLISDAKEEAERILLEAREQVEDIKRQGFEEGKAEGYEAGLLEGREAIGQKEEELLKEKDALAQSKKQMELLYEKNMKEAESFFAQLTGDLVEKITGVQMEERKGVILHLIRQGMEDAGACSQFKIHVSKEDVKLVDKAKELLARSVKKGTDIEILEDGELTKGQCLIETESKIIDSSLGIQLRNLLEDLRLLSIS